MDALHRAMYERCEQTRLADTAAVLEACGEAHQGVPCMSMASTSPSLPYGTARPKSMALTRAPSSLSASMKLFGLDVAVQQPVRVALRQRLQHRAHVRRHLQARTPCSVS